MTEPCADCVRAVLGPWALFTAGCAGCEGRAVASAGRQRSASSTTSKPGAPVLSDRPGLVSCSGKRRYDHKAAKQLARKMRRNEDHKVEGYHCCHCRAWHIGTIKPKDPRPARRRNVKELAE